MTAAGAVEVVLGLDAGTTSAKAVAMDRTGAVRAEAGSDPIPTCSPEPGASEQDPDEIWRAVAAAGRRAVENLPPGARVAALALAAQSGSVVPVRASGRAGPAVTWMDTRSRALVESWPPGVAERIRAVSGWTPAAGYGLSTIARLAGSPGLAQPEAARPGPGPGGATGPDPGSTADPDPVTRWASVDDYLMHRLTGRWATNPSNASGMGLMDVSARTWSEELCRIASVGFPGTRQQRRQPCVNPAALSEIVESGAAVGGLRPEAVAALGVPTGTPVAAGGHDQACAALGLGAVEPGRMFMSAGTAWVLTAVTGKACAGALPPGLNLSPHVVVDHWTVSESLGGLGAEIAEAAPGEARSVFERCARRVGEALARAAAAAAGGPAGAAPAATAAGDGLILVGGGSRLPELVEVMAEVTGRPVVTRPDGSWPARGAALLAASALGWPRREATRDEPILEEAR